MAPGYGDGGASLGVANKPDGSRIIHVPKDFNDIQEAIDASRHGDYISISSGQYVLHQPLLLNKEIHLVGDEDGASDGVVLTLERSSKTLMNPDVHILTVAAPSARISRICFSHHETVKAGRQPSPPKDLLFCLFLKEGNILVDNCTFSSTFASAIGVAGECRPTVSLSRISAAEYGVFACARSTTRLKNNTFTKCQTGVYFDEKALGAAEENHVVECNCGIEMTASACPTLERNVVTGCTEVGVYVSSGNPAAPKMLIRGNQITGNAVGVQIEQCGNPILEKNTVEQNTEAGVRITANGAGEFLLNEIADNAIGVIMDRGSSAKFTKNAVRDNARYGVLVQGQGTFGLLNDNDVAGGAYGVSVSDGAAPSVLQNRVSGTRECAVLLNCAGAAKVNENEIFDNAGDAVQVTQCAVQVQQNTISKNEGKGVWAQGCDGGLYTDNVITHNGSAGMQVSQSQGLQIEDNRLMQNEQEGLLVHNNSRVRVGENVVAENGTHNIYHTNDSLIE